MFIKRYSLLFLLVFNLNLHALSGRTIMINNQTSQDIILHFFDVNCMYTNLSDSDGVDIDSINNTIIKANNFIKVHEESKASGICFFIRSNSSEYKLKASLVVAPYIYTVMKAEAHGSAISRYMKYNTEGGSIQKFKFNFDDNKIYINHE
ncbi:hypothetical protein A0O36_02896 [Piscirickettsiaceae bacterium NZ-RLO1]|nr:hypothetical protein A0O36_02896 [Piscirickettsiaceae bacterium NZ-RLO1]